MNLSRHAFVRIISCLVAGTALSTQAAKKGARPEKGSAAETKKTTWTMTPDPSLPNVLILGDSISIGYTLEVRKLLAGKANVFRPLKGEGPENCSGTIAGVQNIDRWLEGQKWDVIHFNWGLHDMKHVSKEDPAKPSSKAEDPVQATVEVYSKNMETLVKKMQATGAKLIFATTTPVTPGTTNPLRETTAPGLYNDAAVKIMEQNKIPVNDLYALCLPKLDKLQLPKNVHFNAEGSTALAAEVAKKITESLEKSTK
jgi:GDSL-like Lipase/Acylhydrolase family